MILVSVKSGDFAGPPIWKNSGGWYVKIIDFVENVDDFLKEWRNEEADDSSDWNRKSL